MAITRKYLDLEGLKKVFGVVDSHIEEKVNALNSTVTTELGKKADKSELTSYATGVKYDSATKQIQLLNGSTVLGTPIDASDFIKDGMVSNVKVEGDNLVIEFNEDAGTETIEIPISKIFNAENYLTKAEIEANYYNKETIEQKLEDVVGGDALDNYLTKTEAGNTYQTKADMAEYTKTADMDTFVAITDQEIETAAAGE